MGIHELVTQIRDVYLSNKVLAFYVAAGISKDCPAHLPLGEELKQAVIFGFFEAEKERDLSLLREAMKKRTIEEVCGVIQHALKDRKLLIDTMAKILDSDKIVPNQNHRFLARALHEGHIVVTTNYESLVERAYQDLYGSDFPTDHICYDKKTFRRFLRHSPPQVFRRVRNDLGWLLKLHGTFRAGDKNVSSSVMTTIDRVGKGLPPTAQITLVRVLKNCPLVVLGYGCMDIDIVYPVLKATDSSQPIWWVKHTDGRPHVYDTKQLKSLLKEEKMKSESDRSIQTLNIASVLCTRANDQNKRIIWQINAHTSLVILAAMTQIGGSFGVDIKPCRGMVKHWAKGLHDIGIRVSVIERLSILAKLAQVCGPYKAGGRDIYDLSNDLFQAVLTRVQNNIQKARIYQEMGWNKYRQDPEKNTDQAVKLYEKADELLPQDKTLWVDRVSIRGLCALAFRRARRLTDALQIAEQTWKLLPSFIRNNDLPSDPEFLRIFLIKKGIKDSDFDILGTALRRIAAVYSQCVSGPYALATAVQGKYQWRMHPQETRVLRRARNLLETDLMLQQLAGKPLQRIQSANELSIVCSKLGDWVAALAVLEDARIVAGQLSRSYESAQILRNRSLAEEVSGDLGKAVSSLKEAMKLFRGRPNDLHATLWHLGRIQIRNKDENGLHNIERHLADASDWHWKANDHALLGIAYFDINNNRTAARQHFTSMLEQYPKKDNTLDVQAVKNHTYGVDNALANAIASIECLSMDETAEAVSLRTKLTLFRKVLEDLRHQALKSLPFSPANLDRN